MLSYARRDCPLSCSIGAFLSHIALFCTDVLFTVAGYTHLSRVPGQIRIVGGRAAEASAAAPVHCGYEWR